jgi:hypothetical protein
MDAVYICRNGENEELRYSLRSIEFNMPHDNVWVVGGKPDWYSGNYIPVEQSGRKYENARNNLKAIVNSVEISEDFILMNDDFFVIDKIDNVPYWYTGSLKSRIKDLTDGYGPNTTYLRMLALTEKTIRKTGIQEPLDYELHTPMIMNRHKLGPIIEMPSLWRSTYGNLYEVGGFEHEDIKVYSDFSFEKRNGLPIDISNECFLSGSDRSFGLLYKKILKDQFQNPSKYE